MPQNTDKTEVFFENKSRKELIYKNCYTDL
jgi:hypothetical protein